MKKFDAEVCMKQYGGKCVTRDGREVRILATDRKNDEYPIVGLVKAHDGEEETESWTRDGNNLRSQAPSEYDLFLPSPKKEIWVVLKGRANVVVVASDNEEIANEFYARIRGKKKIIRLEFDPEEAWARW